MDIVERFGSLMKVIVAAERLPAMLNGSMNISDLLGRDSGVLVVMVGAVNSANASIFDKNLEEVRVSDLANDDVFHELTLEALKAAGVAVSLVISITGEAFIQPPSARKEFAKADYFSQSVGGMQVPIASRRHFSVWVDWVFNLKILIGRIAHNGME